MMEIKGTTMTYNGKTEALYGMDVNQNKHYHQINEFNDAMVMELTVRRKLE